jgi:NTE family protein
MPTPTNAPMSSPRPPIRIGLALGGGFARGIAHAGVLKVFEAQHIPLHCVTGVSAGAIAAAAYASGATSDEITRAGCSLRLADVGQWRPGRLGLVRNQCLTRFLARLLKTSEFEQMRIPLGVVATDFYTRDSVPFFGCGSVFDPVRASCAFPGLFQPVRHGGRVLVDGAMSAGVPAALAKQLGATHVISVALPPSTPSRLLGRVYRVVKDCFQLPDTRSDDGWRRDSDLVITPDVAEVDWYAFGRGSMLVQAGEAAALAALPTIQEWLGRMQSASETNDVPTTMVA